MFNKHLNSKRFFCFYSLSRASKKEGNHRDNLFGSPCHGNLYYSSSVIIINYYNSLSVIITIFDKLEKINKLERKNKYNENFSNLD